QALGQSDGRRRLALAERRRADRGDDDVLAARPFPLDALDRGEGDLRLRVAVRLDLVVPEAEVVGDVHDRTRGDGARDLEIGREAHRTPRVLATGPPDTVAGSAGGGSAGPWDGTIETGPASVAEPAESPTSGASSATSTIASRPRAARTRWARSSAFVSGP